MSPSPKVQRLALLGFALVQIILGCTLTSDSFTPAEAVRNLDPTPDAGDPSPPAEPSGEPAADPPNMTCSQGSELVGCDIDIEMPGGACESDLDCASQACVDGSCAAPSCNDSRQNGDEAGVDCGGTCEACEPTGCDDDGDCDSRNCEGGRCLDATCDDGIANQGEPAADCAGPCPTRCAAGDACTQSADCAASLFCPEQTLVCTTVSCQDEALNGDEIVADCGGGTCPGCPIGTPCENANDCITGVCGNDDVCAAPTCDDDVRNQNETGVDCGGACPDCPTGEPCGVGGDCQSVVCGGAGCDPGVNLCCQAPSCNDGVRNGNEPVIDCGNAGCGLCGNGENCSANAQCTTGFCQAGFCRVQPCADGVQSGNETDTDCGGNDPACQRCPLGDTCAINGDCVNGGTCTNGVCAACGDGVRNGIESDTDCGGVCGDCDPGDDCNVDADCQSGACQDGTCCGGTQADCTRCARRLSGATNCNVNGAAAAPTCNAFLDCLADNPGVCIGRHSPGCSEDPGGVCNNTAFGGNGSPGLVTADAVIGTAQCLF